MWNKIRTVSLVLALLAMGTAWMLPTADAEAPVTSSAAERAVSQETSPTPPPTTLELEELLRQEVLDCSQYPNPRCDPNIDPNCKCDPECDPEVDSECVICENICSGPMVDPTG